MRGLFVGTLAAMKAAKSNKVERIVITSSGGAFLNIPPPPGKRFTTTDVQFRSHLVVLYFTKVSN